MRTSTAGWNRRIRSLALAGVMLACVMPARAGAADLAVLGRGIATIPTGFVGLSLEYNSILPLAGPDPGHVNPVFVTLLRAMATADGGRLVLRIGGNSTDDAWWPEGRRDSMLMRYALTPTWTSVLSALLRQSGAGVILGVNFAIGRPTIARYEAQQLLARLPSGSVGALELGNEPEIYASFPRFLGPGRRPVFARTPGRWSYARYRSELRLFVDYLRAVRGSIPLAAPASGSASWVPSLGSFIAQTRSDLGLVTYHAYPLLRCHVGRGSSLSPSIAHLMAERSSHGLAARFAGLVRISNIRQIPFRFGEVNNVACGGAVGVSDTFASALWTVDTLFELASTGAAGVNLHMAQGLVYSPFQFSRRSGVWHASVRPEAYGMLLFGQAAPAGSRLLAIRMAAVPGLKAWATRDDARTIRVVLINKSSVAARVVLLGVGGNHGKARVQRLQAPSLSSTVASGPPSLGGLSYGANTTTGLPHGRPIVAIVRRTRGVYPVRIARASAVIVTIPR